MNSLKQVAKSVLPAQAWGALKRRRQQFDRWRFQPYEVHHTYSGTPLNVWIGDELGRGWYDQDWEPMAELELLQTHKLRPGARVFDLGAHQCVVAILLSRIVGPNGSVVALEATRASVEIANRNRLLNAAENLEIVHAAVAAESGSIVFTLDGHVENNHEKSANVSVDAFSIDDLAKRYGVPDVLFIDVEGYECKALEGATETLRTKPDCFVEVHGGVGLENFGGTLDKVLSFFPSQDFELFAAWPDCRFAKFTDKEQFHGRRFFLISLSR